MSAKLYANENIPLPLVERLRNLGYDVQTSNDAGLSNLRTPDDRVLEHATSSGRAVLTLNWKHFKALHRVGTSHAGIVGFPPDTDAAGLASRIDAALKIHVPADNKCLRVTKGGCSLIDRSASAQAQ